MAENKTHLIPALEELTTQQRQSCISSGKSLPLSQHHVQALCRCLQEGFKRLRRRNSLLTCKFSGSEDEMDSLSPRLVGPEPASADLCLGTHRTGLQGGKKAGAECSQYLLPRPFGLNFSVKCSVTAAFSWVWRTWTTSQPCPVPTSVCQGQCVIPVRNSNAMGHLSVL